METIPVVELIVDKLQGWLEAFIVMLPNLMAAILVVILFWLIARLARNGLYRLLNRVSSYAGVNRLLATTGYIIVLAAGVFVALGVVGLDGTVTSLLAGAGIIALAIGFAFQDIGENILSGIFLSVHRPFDEGDLIKTNDYFGTVYQLNIRSTMLRILQGQIVVIPNKLVFQNPIINYTTTGKRRIDLRCGVAYGDDLEKAEQLAVEAITSLEGRDTSRDVELFYEEFGGSSVNFVIRYWIDFGNRQPDFLKAQSEGIKKIKQTFDENGITIPFPITTLDFGVVGGEKLSEVLPRRFYDQTV